MLQLGPGSSGEAAAAQLLTGLGGGLANGDDDVRNLVYQCTPSADENTVAERYRTECLNRRTREGQEGPKKGPFESLHLGTFSLTLRLDDRVQMTRSGTPQEALNHFTLTKRHFFTVQEIEETEIGRLRSGATLEHTPSRPWTPRADSEVAGNGIGS